ncbi:MAG TPA: hypothetical protein VGE00_09620 [Gammaproteobacteria bacterium]
MKQRVLALFGVFGLSGCVSVEMPAHLVSDTANVAKDAYHAIVGDEGEAAAKEKGEEAAAPSAEGAASTAAPATTTAPATPDPASSAPAAPQTGEYEYVYVGDEGISLKEAKATCFKNASVLARRAAGKTTVDPRLVSEKAELDGDTIVVTCKVSRE